MNKEVARNLNNFNEDNLELASVSSLKAKLPPDNSVVFYYCTLEDALNSITRATLDEKKILLFYLHNSEKPFSQMFLQHLNKKEKLSKVLRENYIVVGWDLDNSSFHDHLVNVLNRHPVLSAISEFVKKQVAAAFCILSYENTIKLASCVKDAKIARVVENLEEVQKMYKEHLKAEKEEKDLEAETGNDNDISPERMQNIWAQMLGDRDYDRFEYDEHEALKDKIAFALKGPPEAESGYDKKQLKEIEKIYEKIKAESSKIAEVKDRVEIAVFYVCLVPLAEEKMKKRKKDPNYKPVTDWCPLPVFRLRKCRKSRHSVIRFPCSVLIDHTGRVYQTWTSYLTNNKYPKGHIIVPKAGRYQWNTDVLPVEDHLSPACHITKKLLVVGDVTSIVASVGSAAIGVGAAIPALAALPVLAPPVLFGAAITGGAGVLWTLGRSIHHLVDRSMHNEEIGWANSEARGAYLNIVASSLGFVGAGANVVLSQLVRRGVNVGQGAAFAFNSISVLNLSASGVSLANSTYDVLDRLINENELPSTLTLMQLSASVLFFAHAAYSFKSAQTIIDETQAATLRNFQDLLSSNRLRKMFNKLLKESIRVHGNENKGAAEVILSMRKIPSKTEVFAALTRNNKLLNEKGVKFSAQNGDIYFNGMKVDLNQFMGLSGKRTEKFLVNLGKEPIPVQNSSSSSSSTVALKSAIANVISDFKIKLSNMDLLQVVQLTKKIVPFLSKDVLAKVVNAVLNSLETYLLERGKEVFEELDKILPKDVWYMKFINMAISYFREQAEELERRYQLYQITGDPQYYSTIFDKVNLDYFKRIVTFFEWVVNNSYSDEKLATSALRKMVDYVHSWIAGIIFEKRQRDAKEKQVEKHSKEYEVRKVCCELCEGHYFQPV
ncbi:uncharacterized protein LOC126739502 [Anthonomus grandis grandis]|uniref:uncharacterized protein LOC126739502 n=1 Tax=Anthonomus grandis grandis TaxID=2921223 RepID=UPI00216593B7|nr:uncharacterized protein LOC126739502 [Anthonomus grandis grandis]